MQSLNKAFLFVLFGLILITQCYAASFEMLQAAGTGVLANVALSPLWVGGGGLVTGFNAPAADGITTGVLFQKTDSAGAWQWDTSLSQWIQVAWTQRATPGAYFGFNPTTNTNVNQVYTQGGVQEIVGCPSSSSCAYLFMGSNVFVSTNVNPANAKALTWTQDNLGVFCDTSNTVPNKEQGPALAVDPYNPDHVIVGGWSNPNQGCSNDHLYESFNARAGASATWTQIDATSPSGAQVATSSNSGYRIVFDSVNGSMTCHVGSGTCAKFEYIYTDFNNTSSGGIYKSANAGSSFVVLNGVSQGFGPQGEIHQLVMNNSTTGGGDIWATEFGGSGNANLWQFTFAGTWTKRLSGVVYGVAINPANGNHIVAQDGNSRVYTSTTGATGIGSCLGYNFNVSDAPWQGFAQAVQNPSPSCTAGGMSTLGAIVFDPTLTDQLWMNGGQGTWTFPLPSSAPFTVTLKTTHQEELLIQNVVVPSQGVAVFNAQDEGGCTLTIAVNATSNAQQCNPLGQINTFGLYGGDGVGFVTGSDAIPNSGLTFEKFSNTDFGNTFELSGVSTDGFVNNYTPFGQWSSGPLASTAISSGTGGDYRITTNVSALTTYSNGSGSIVCLIYYQGLGGVSTSPAGNIGCWPATVGAGFVDLTGSTFATTSSTATYVAWWPSLNDDVNGIYTIYGVAADASHGNLVQVTLSYQAGQFAQLQNGVPICITGVTGSFTNGTVVNGCWITSNVSDNTVDLAGSSFKSGDSYTSGGTFLGAMAPGGGVAAASASNYVVYGADHSYPRCTSNGGGSFSPLRVTGDNTEWNAGGANLQNVTVSGNVSAGAGSLTLSQSGLAANPGVIYIPLNSGRTFVVTGGSISGTTLTFNNGQVVPPLDQINSGAPLSTDSGYPFAVFFVQRYFTADSVTANTIYGINNSVGLFKTTNCGTPVILQSATPQNGFLGETGANQFLKSVPGEAGHLFFTAGPQYGSGLTHPGNTQLWRTCQASGGAGSVTMQAYPYFFEPQAFGFGKAAPGQNYPAIIVEGWLDQTGGNSRNSAQWGIWRNTTDPNHGATGSCTIPAYTTWTNLVASNDPNQTQIQWGSANDLSGDPFVYGPVYFSGVPPSYLIQN